MRFSCVLAFVTLAFPLLAAADCSTGSVQCCQSLQSVTSSEIAETLAGSGLLGIVNINAILGNTNGLVGLACAPLSLLSLGGTSCSTQPVCCTNNFVGGIIQAGCTPADINV